MESIASIPGLTPRTTASLAVLGLTTIVTAGVAACVATILAILWGLVELALLFLQATVSTLTVIGSTFIAAQPTIRLLVLVLIAYAVYRVYRQVSKR